jgi:hypothetical protein
VVGLDLLLEVEQHRSRRLADALGVVLESGDHTGTDSAGVFKARWTY